jgi:organic radical activating enzyme
MCNPEQSSLIAKDEKVFVTPINGEVIDNIIDKITKNQSKIQEIYLSGGEPFYIPQNIKLLKSLSNKDIPIRINTNMHWQKNNRLFEILKTFNNVQLTMSVDALYDKFSYIRTGGNWQTFIDNLNFIRNETDFEIRVNMIFSIINAVDVPENIKYFYHTLGIKDITINLLEIPRELAPMNYPENKKQDIIDKLENVLATISPEYKNLTAQIKLCIGRIKLPKEQDYKNKMDEITKRYDKHWTEVHKDLI